MNDYVFAVSNRPIMAIATSIEAMCQNCDEYFSVVLNGDDELRILMRLLGVVDLVQTSLPSNGDFTSVFDYSAQRLPQLSQDGFDAFYDSWLRASGREPSMDEYGQLLFLQGRADRWNSMASRFVLCETRPA